MPTALPLENQNAPHRRVFSTVVLVGKSTAASRVLTALTAQRVLVATSTAVDALTYNWIYIPLLISMTFMSSIWSQIIHSIYHAFFFEWSIS